MTAKQTRLTSSISLLALVVPIGTAILGCASTLTSQSPSSTERREPAAAGVSPSNSFTKWGGPCVNNGGEKVDVKGAISERCDRVVQTSRGPKTVHVLTLRGTPQQTAYAHGYLMAREIEEGILKTVTDITKASTTGAKALLFNCYTNRMKRSVSKEFLDSVYSLWDGYQSRLYTGSNSVSKGKTPVYSSEQALEAILVVELSNISEGLAKRLETNPAVIAEVIGACGLKTPINIIGDAIRGMGEQSPKLGGCLGMSVPAHLAGGNMIHARNLDIDMVDGWNKHPTLFLVEQPGKARFAASAAAGMAVPGGIGGMNEHGLAISLHQMSTTKYVSEMSDRTGVTAPELAQKILEEARTIEDAEAIINKGKNFAAWTMFISEANTGRVSAIEFSGERVRTVYKVQNETKGQTNHFIDPEMQDQAFTYNYNKFFESKSRLRYMENELQTLTPQKPASVAWVMSKLAGHKETLPDSVYPFNANRAFGRTAVKAYNVMSVAMIPSKQEYWSTIAERKPAAHSTWVGYKIDWQKLQATPIATARAHDYDAIPNWDQSLEKYVEARQAYQSYLENNPKKARQLLSEAIELAKKDGIEELPYHFMRARVTQDLALHEKGEVRKQLMREALVDWDYLWQNRERLYIYGQALVATYSTAAEDEIDSKFDSWDMATVGDRYYFKRLPERQEKIEIAKEMLEQLSSRFTHFDLDAKRALVEKLMKPQRNLALPSLDFVVVEQ